MRRSEHVAARSWEDGIAAFLPDQGAAGAPPIDRTAGLSLILVSTTEGLDTLRDDWAALFERAAGSAHVFQSFEWLRHWCRHFLATGGATLAIVAGRRDGRLVLVLPAAVERVAGVKVVTWAGLPVSQYGDAIVEPGRMAYADLMQAWQFLVASVRPDLASMPRVRADANATLLMEGLGGTAVERLAAPYLDLGSAPSFHAYQQRYGGKAVKNRRRLMRRLEEIAPVRFEIVREGPRASELVGQAIAMKRRWLAHKGLVSVGLDDDRTLAFFTQAAGSAEAPPGLRVGALYCGDTLAAIEIAVISKDRHVIHIMAYDLEFEKSAVGVLLMERMIAESFATGARAYDLMAPADSYKADWADDAIAVTSYTLPLTLKGRLYADVWLARLRPRIKRAYGRLPIGWRRALQRKAKRAD